MSELRRRLARESQLRFKNQSDGAQTDTSTDPDQGPSADHDRERSAADGSKTHYANFPFQIPSVIADDYTLFRREGLIVIIDDGKWWGTSAYRSLCGTLFTYNADLTEFTETPCKVSCEATIEQPPNPSETLRRWMQSRSFILRPVHPPRVALGSLIAELDACDLCDIKNKSTFKVDVVDEKIRHLKFSTEIEVDCFPSETSEETGEDSVSELVPFRLELHFSTSSDPDEPDLE